MAMVRADYIRNEFAGADNIRFGSGGVDERFGFHLRWSMMVFRDPIEVSLLNIVTVLEKFGFNISVLFL